MADTESGCEYFEIGSVRLRYRWAGADDRPVLVLSHTLGSDSNLWKAQEEQFGKNFRLLLFDHRGHGGSSSPPKPWTIDDFGKDALHLIEHLTNEPVFFCGVSLGGMLGIWLAQNAPERLRKVAVANTSAFTEDPALLRSRLAVIEKEGLSGIADNVLDRWFTPGFHQAHPDVVEEFRARLLSMDGVDYQAAGEAVCGLDLRDGLSAISTPLLVITGKHDRATPPSWGEAIANSVPGAELVELDAAHLSNIEADKAFSRAVSGFFATT